MSGCISCGSVRFSQTKRPLCTLGYTGVKNATALTCGFHSDTPGHLASMYKAVKNATASYSRGRRGTDPHRFVPAASLPSREARRTTAKLDAAASPRCQAGYSDPGAPARASRHAPAPRPRCPGPAPARASCCAPSRRRAPHRRGPPRSCRAPRPGSERLRIPCHHPRTRKPPQRQRRHGGLRRAAAGRPTAACDAN